MFHKRALYVLLKSLFIQRCADVLKTVGAQITKVQYYANLFHPTALALSQPVYLQTLYLDAVDNPFNVVDTILEDIDTPNIIVDFHAEATSEKKAMGFYLQNRVTAVLGTHTHVQTADETILGGHTAYITDVGMTGPELSVLGVDKDIVITKFKKHIPVKFLESSEKCFINAVVVEFDEKTGKALDINRLIIR